MTSDFREAGERSKILSPSLTEIDSAATGRRSSQLSCPQPTRNARTASMYGGADISCSARAATGDTHNSANASTDPQRSFMAAPPEAH